MKAISSPLDINPQFQIALDLMENSDQPIFITGKAGTGKSTLLSYWREQTKKQIAVLAPTGVAALNVKGQTIHSFFRFLPDITVDKVKKVNDEKDLYKNLDAIVIDEVSMVRADLLDCIDRFLRLNGPDRTSPFGGVQLIFFGDLYQLPPVVTSEEQAVFKEYYDSPYFFSAQAMQDLPMAYIELDHVYRQKDSAFIELLNAVRNNSVTDIHIKELNRRFMPDHSVKDNEFTITLTSTNELARTVNESRLARLKGKIYSYEGRLSGTFERRSLPTETILNLKVGSQIMLLNNDSQKRWVNGTIGKIIKIKVDKAGNRDEELAGPDILIVELTSGATVEVTPYTWEMYELHYDKSLGQLESEVTGSFTQYPLRLAWAVTIHKSQGKTFDQVVIDVGRGTFAHGQMYVALSRCTSFEGLVLKQELEPRHIRMDWRVVKFITGYQYALAEEAMPIEEKVELLERAIAGKAAVKIEYLKANDERSSRIIEPRALGEREYGGKLFLGLDAYCRTRKEVRVFRVDRILALEREA